MQQPSVSVIIPTLNSSRTLDECLSSIRVQDYPQDLIEILIMDGGSTDGTGGISIRHNARFIDGGYRENQEARKGLGLIMAQNEYALYIDSDNILPNSQWLNQMVRPFYEHPEVIATQTWRYGLKPGFGIMNRYCALIGANDPVPFYLGKCEKISHFNDEWRRTPILKDCGDYFLVNFTLDNLPTVGANGFVIKKGLLLDSNCTPDQFFHIDVISDLVKAGHNPFAMVRNEIYHDTSSKLSNLAVRRVKYFMEHSPSKSARRYFVFDIHQKKDVLGMLRFVIHSATVFPALFFAWQGYRRKKDAAWFLHPYVCLSFLVAYAFSSIYLFVTVRSYLFGQKTKKYWERFKISRQPS